MKKFRSLTTSFVFTAYLCAAIIIATGCSKKDNEASSGGGKGLLADPLLLSLPASTAGFGIADFSGEGYALFKRSPYGKPTDAKTAFQELSEKLQSLGANAEAVQVVEKLFGAATKMGIVLPDGTYAPEAIIAKAVLFANPTNNQELPVEFGAFIQMTQGAVADEKVGILRAALTDSGVKTSDETIAGGTAFSISIANNPVKLYVAANKTVCGCSVSKAALEGLLSSTRSTALTELQNLPEYKRATSKLDKTDKPLGFAFVSLNRFGATLEKLAKQNGSQDFNAKEVPLEAVAILSSFPKEYIYSIGMAVTPRTESQTKILQALETSSLSSQSTKLPSDTALALALDARFLSKIDSLVESIDGAGAANVLDQVKNVGTIALGLRNNSSGSPVPDIFLSVDSTDPKALSTSVEQSLGAAASMTGQGANWQTKEIAGNQTRYFTTLIGAGVYMTSPKNSKNLLLGTSEGLIRDLSASQSGASAGVTATLSAALKEQLSAANVGLFYLNFARVAEVLESVKSTLAMFTGGNSELNELLDSTKMSSWGLAIGSVSYAPGALVISASMDSSASGQPK